jgi:hypothetical protein
MIIVLALAYLVAGIASARWMRRVEDFWGEEDIIVAVVLFWPAVWAVKAIVKLVRA